MKKTNFLYEHFLNLLVFKLNLLNVPIIHNFILINKIITKLKNIHTNHTNKSAFLK